MTETTREMPRYRCHKEVWALKIRDIALQPGGHAVIIPEEKGYEAVRVDATWMLKHKPQIGGYYVVYRDGYQSFSPADAFESGYTRI